MFGLYGNLKRILNVCLRSTVTYVGVVWNNMITTVLSLENVLVKEI